MKKRLIGGLLLPALMLAAPAGAADLKLVITELTTPLIPNSVMDLAHRLGYYKRAGVDVEIVRVQQTPSAVAALSSGSGDMANIAFSTALQLVARDQMKLKAVVSPDKALPFVVVGKKDIASVKALEGRSFGVGRMGSLDHTLSKVVLSKMGVGDGKLSFVALGQPSVRAQSLAAGRVDATTISIGEWTSLPDKSALAVLVPQAAFYKAAPMISKVNVVSEATMKSKGKHVQALVAAIMTASRDFAADPKKWVDAMAEARPDVKRETLETLAEAYRESWSANGGLNLDEAQYTTELLYQGDDFKDLRKVAPAEWIDVTLVDAVRKESGTIAALDSPGR